MAILCPKCGSDQVAATKKGFGAGKAAAGWFFLGPVGLLGGVVGASKVMVTCLACGYSWEPGAAPAARRVAMPAAPPAPVEPLGYFASGLLLLFGLALLGLGVVVVIRGGHGIGAAIGAGGLFCALLAAASIKARRVKQTSDPDPRSLHL